MTIRYHDPSIILCQTCGKLSHFDPCEDCLWWLTDIKRWVHGKLGAEKAIKDRVARILKRAREEKHGRSPLL